MSIIYDAHTLDTALACSGSRILEERKKGEKILRQATCLEIGTKNTKPVREWFVSHTDEIISMISAEKDSQLLWGYIYMLQSFCQRYIGLAFSVKNSDDFLNNSRTRYFQEQDFLCVQSMIPTENMQVLQAVGSFLWVYHDSRTWDIFTQVLKKKRDKLTLSHITVAVSNCYHLITERKTVYDFSGNLLDHAQLISKEQIMNLRARLQVIEVKPVPSEHNRVSRAIHQMDALFEN